MTMSKFNNIHFSLDQLNDGAVAEQVMEQIQRVADNIFDPNTDPKAKRTVTMKLTLNSTDDNKTISLSAQVTSKLAPSNKSSTTLLGGINGSGDVELSELRSAAPGQMMINPDTGEMMTDVGLPVAKEVNPDAVIDMRTGKELI